MGEWAARLERCQARCYAGVRHGDYPAWEEALRRLPALEATAVRLDADEIQVGRAADCDERRRRELRQQLQRLIPWRKGPFNLFGVSLDAEWRADLKWRRLCERITPLAGRCVLDVGCGNGYYGWRMLGAGARLVVGVDAALKYVMQQRMVARYLPEEPFAALPLALGPPQGDGPALPRDGAAFDTVFSMGVLYHQRDPVRHLRDLAAFLREGGELVLESLVIEEADGELLRPRERYAGMRNVWAVPSIPTLTNWLAAAGFDAVQTADVSVTTPAEQRATPWTFPVSLADFLAPGNPRLTVEGYPAPRRALLICTKAGGAR